MAHWHWTRGVSGSLGLYCVVVLSVVKPQFSCWETLSDPIDLDSFLLAELLPIWTEWDRGREGERWVVFQNIFVGCDKWDIPGCIKLPYNTLLGSYPESLCCACVCWSKPCDSQLTTNIKHLKTELGLGRASSEVHPLQFMCCRGEPERKFDSLGNAETQPENCYHLFHFH